MVDFFPIDPFVDRKSSLFINTGVEVLLLVGAKVHMYLLVHMAPQNINLVIKSKILPYTHSMVEVHAPAGKLHHHLIYLVFHSRTYGHSL